MMGLKQSLRKVTNILALAGSLAISSLSYAHQDMIYLINGINGRGHEAKIAHYYEASEGVDGFDTGYAKPPVWTWGPKITTEIEGSELEVDKRPTNSASYFNTTLGVFVDDNSYISETNQILVKFTDNVVYKGPDPARVYIGEININSNYTANGQSFHDVRDLVKLVAPAITNYCNWDLTFLGIDGTQTNENGVINYGTLDIKCPFKTEELVVTNNLNGLAGIVGGSMKMIRVPEVSEGFDVIDDTNNPNVSTNNLVYICTQPYGTNLFTDARTTNNSSAFSARIYAANNLEDLLHLTNSLGFNFNIGPEPDRTRAAYINIPTNFTENGVEFTTNSVITNGLSIPIALKVPRGTNEVGTVDVKTVFQVISSNGDNGSISPLGTNMVAVGDNFSITANENYHVYLVTTNNGVAVSNDLNSLSSTNFQWTIDGTGTIHAAFAPNKYTLSVSSPHGTPIPSGTTTNEHGSSLECRISGSPIYSDDSKTQYVCVGWTMVGNSPESGTGTNFSMSHTNTADLTWNWATNHLLNLTQVNGTISGGEDGQYYNQELKLTNTPNLNHHFTGWYGDTNGCIADGNKLTVPMNIPRSITASNSIDQVALEIISEFGNTLPATGTYTGNYGGSFNVFITNTPVSSGAGSRAVADGGYAVGNDFNLNSLTNISIPNHTNDAQIIFSWLKQNELMINQPANGTISGAEDGWKNESETLTITNTPNQHYHQVGFFGDTQGCATNGNALSVPMNIPRSITASNEVNIYTVSTIASGNGTINPQNPSLPWNTSTNFYISAEQPGNRINSIRKNGSLAYTNSGDNGFISTNLAYIVETGTGSVQVVFEPKRYLVTVTATNKLGQSVGNPSPGTGTYPYGTHTQSIDAVINDPVNTNKRYRVSGYTLE